MRVGLIDRGRMGAAIARRPRERCIQVTSFDADDRKCKTIRPKNIQIVKNCALVTESSDVIVSIVTDGHAVRSVFSEMLQGEVADKAFILLRR